MMYQDKLAVAIKHNGKILREKQDLVQLPFGSEFSVLVKNLNSRRVKFTLHIDGTDVLEGTEIIVNANSEVEMKRFIRNGNMTEGNAFKFIERTQAIEDGPRGVKVDDGVVRVQFWFEKEAPEIKTVIHNDIWWNDYRYPYRSTIWGSGPYYGSDNFSKTLGDVKLGSDSATKGVMRGIGGSSVNAVYSSNASSTSATYNAAQTIPSVDSFTAPEINEAGITVPGSKVEQKFQTVYGFSAEATSHVIVLRLTGRIGAVEVAEPVTVKTKQKCSTCGKVNKATSKFCTDCGTSLELI